MILHMSVHRVRPALYIDLGTRQEQLPAVTCIDTVSYVCYKLTAGTIPAVDRGAFSARVENMPDSTELQIPSACKASLITTLPDLETLAERMMASPIVSVDTESDSLYSYTEKICLVQVSLPDEDYIIDPLTIFSLEPLADVFACAGVEKIFHGADYDLVSLKRQYGFHVANIFDTMVAARILGRKNTGLASLSADILGLKMDKTQQRSDWGKRPLSAEQLAYACHDTRYLLTLRGHLLTELHKVGREQEAREAFADLARVEPKPRAFDQDAFWNIKGVRDLDSAGQTIVSALYQWRDEQARWEDRPVFKTMNDRTLVALAENRPGSYDALRGSRILSSYQVTRYGHAVVDAMTKAQRSGERPRPPHNRNNRTRPDDLTLSLYERLRAWRRERAAQRGVEPDVITSNDVLMTIATRQPCASGELEDISGLGSWRRHEYGEEITALVVEFLSERGKKKT
jgi:ribonuclease D